jgi:CRISPR-associated protein Cas1
VDGHSGYISLQAFHWLSRNKIPIFILDYDGTMISSILPPAPVKADLRAAQLKASEDAKKKFTIASAIVRAKVARSLQVLDWLAQRYDIEKQFRLTRHEALKLGKARSVVDLRTVEGRVALRYWQAYSSVLPESLDFQGRMTTSHQNNASDQNVEEPSTPLAWSLPSVSFTSSAATKRSSRSCMICRNRLDG